jgi:superfamily II DNA/RNA helicase
LNSLKLMQFTTPTPIQSQTIPPALQGSDVLGSAQTGTGKTAAYGIPLVAHVLAQPTNAALVLAPTRELAAQVLETINLLLGKHSEIKTSLLIGGDSMVKQLRQLQAKPRVVVGTPGRINDHLERGTLNLSHTNFLVLDETDRMLDMGFSAQLQEIVRYLPKVRQTLMFSATMAPEIVRIANTYLNDPVRIAVGSTTTPTAAITQEVVKTIEADKLGLLLELLESRQGTVIVFVKTKFGTERLALRLRKEGHDVDAIHGDLRQTKRDRVIKDFRAGKSRVLVATDVAARGLDIPHIECVVNYDLPQCPEDYIHRIGRTGRAGAQGHAMSLVTGQDFGKWRMIAKLMSNNGTSEIRMDNRIGKPAQIKEKSADETSEAGHENADAHEKKASNRSRSVDVDFEVKPRFSRDADRGDRKERSFGDRPARPFGERKSFGDRPSFGGERKPFGDRPRFDDRKERSFGDRPARPFGERKSFGDRPSFGGERKPFGDRKERSFGDRPARPFGERKPFGDRPSFGGERKPFGDRPRFDDRKERSFGDRPARPFGERKSFGDRPSFGGERKPFGDRPRFDDRKERSFGDRPARPFGERKSFGDRPSFGGERKPFGDREGRRPKGPFVDALVDTAAWKRPSFSSARRFDKDSGRFSPGFVARKKKREDREKESE